MYEETSTGKRVLTVDDIEIDGGDFLGASIANSLPFLPLFGLGLVWRAKRAAKVSQIEVGVCDTKATLASLTTLSLSLSLHLCVS